MRTIFYMLLLLISGHSGFCQGTNPRLSALSGRYGYLIEAPTSADSLGQWRSDLSRWKDTLLSYVRDDAHRYADPRYRWASTAYSCFFLMANDLALYDKEWHFDIRGMLAKYERNYGGVDIVLLWATYPQLGFDNRDQYTFYRNLPGAVTALKKLGEELHRMGKKFFIAFNPWDQIARNNGKNDEDELIRLVRDIGADGIFLDTISGVDGFRKKLDPACPGVVFQSEISPAPALLPEVQQSWVESLPWRDSLTNPDQLELPYVLRSRWLEQRHMVYHLSRWSHEQSRVIQDAWMNGCGIVLWENIFGTLNFLNARDRSLLRSMMPLLHRYSDFFTRGQWTPLVPVRLPHVYASRWQLGESTCWTIVNRTEKTAAGQLFEMDPAAGTKYFDLVAGRPADLRIKNGKTFISMRIKPGGIGCLLAINGKTVDAGFLQFLQKQAATAAGFNADTTYTLATHRLRPVAPTRKYPINHLPPGMVGIAGSQDSIDLAIHFRQRECGFYPAKRVTDISYTMALDRPGLALRRVKINAFAMDETPVTNAAFYAFLHATRYQPPYANHFLENWVDGHPPEGEENRPVTWITIDDARAYARWAGKRLPTEEEWQWAAQSGKAGFEYPWGNDYDSSRCNHGQTGGSTDVKRFPGGRTASGLYDLCGNVWQYTESERTDGHNHYIILRGGSWYITRGSGWYADQGPQKTNFASKYLLLWPGLDRCATLGFRCVVDQ